MARPPIDVSNTVFKSIENKDSPTFGVLSKLGSDEVEFAIFQLAASVANSLDSFLTDIENDYSSTCKRKQASAEFQEVPAIVAELLHIAGSKVYPTSDDGETYKVKIELQSPVQLGCGTEGCCDTN